MPSTSSAMGPMDPKLLAMAGLDMKMLAGMDPKAFPPPSSSSKSADLVAGMDPKMLAAAGIDPNMIKGMDPKVLAQMGLDPKTLAAALDPKNVAKSMPAGVDPKMMSMMMGMDPRCLLVWIPR